MLGFMRTDVTPSSFKALRACEPSGRKMASVQLFLKYIDGCCPRSREQAVSSEVTCSPE